MRTGRDFSWAILPSILLLAFALRFIRMGESPPGLHPDEAETGWAAWCMLKTGTDDNGAPWPIFSFRCGGENCSTLYLYYLIPFLAAGGLSIATLRIASATAGLAAVILAHAVGVKLFSRSVGWIAAALIAVSPWGLLASRWSHESSLVPVLVLLPVWLMLCAQLPLSDATPPRSRPALALLAGITAGVACYGYPTVRIFMPLFLVGIVLANLSSWWNLVKTRRGAVAAGGLLLGFAATFGPLAWQHVVNGKVLNKRAASGWVWSAGDSLMDKALSVLTRYPGHFGPDFLVLRGDHYPVASVPGWGMFHGYVLPLLLAGLATLAWRSRNSRSARFLLVWLLLYPAGDLLRTQTYLGEMSMHAPRSLPGLGAIVLLGGVGASEAGAWLWRRSRSVSIGALAAFLATVIVLNLAFLRYFFGGYNLAPDIYHRFSADLVEASEWLRSRRGGQNIVVFPQNVGMGNPHLITLVVSRYDPVRWLNDPHIILTDDPEAWSRLPNAEAVRVAGPNDFHLRYGDWYFIDLAGHLNAQEVGRALGIDRPVRMILGARPGQMEVEGAELVHETWRGGTRVLLIYRLDPRTAQAERSRSAAPGERESSDAVAASREAAHGLSPAP